VAKRFPALQGSGAAVLCRRRCAASLRGKAVPAQAELSPVARQLLIEFGKRFKEARMVASLTQSDVARVRTVGEGHAYISRIEKGRVNLTIGTMVEIADAIGVDYSTSFGPQSDLGERQDGQCQPYRAMARKSYIRAHNGCGIFNLVATSD